MSPSEHPYEDRERQPHGPQHPVPGDPNYTVGDPQPGYVEPEVERRRLQREENRVAQAQQATVASKFVQMITYLVGALELLLLLRFILRLSAANPDNTFASFIYGLSEPFVAPFSTLFISPTFGGSNSIFDINVLVAMVAYAVLLMLLKWLTRIITTP